MEMILVCRRQKYSSICNSHEAYNVNDIFSNDIAIKTDQQFFLPENLVRNFKNPFVNDVMMMLIMLWWPYDVALLFLRIILEMHFAQFVAISFDFFLHNF